MRRFDRLGSPPERLQQHRQPAQIVTFGDMVRHLASQADRLTQRCDRRLGLTAEVTRECVALQPDHAIGIGGGVRAAQCERVEARGFTVGSQRRGLLGGGTVGNGSVVVTSLVGMKASAASVFGSAAGVASSVSARRCSAIPRSRESAPGWPCGPAHA